MPSLACLLALLLGCSGGDEAAAPPPQPIPPPAQPAPGGEGDDEAGGGAAAGGKKGLDETPPAPPAAPEGLAQLAAAGHHEAALAAAREAVASSPGDPVGWRLLGQAALAAGQGEAVLAGLDAGQAEGGEAAAHHLLRAELALAAGKPAVAFEAAGLAAMHDADAGAGAQALALEAGAALPREAAQARPDAAAPTVALLRLVTAKDAAAAQAWADGAAQVSGWRADLARGRALARLGQTDAARAAFEEAAGAEDPRAGLAGHLGLAELARQAGDQPGALQAARAGAEAAASGGDVLGAARALEVALAAGQAGLDLDGPLAAAQAVAEKAMAAAGGALAPELALALGRAGLLAGRPGEVVRPLWTASVAVAESGHPQRTALDGMTALAGTMVGLEVAVTAVAFEGGNTPAAALAAATAGIPGYAPDLSGLADVDAALLGLAATEAHVDAGQRLELLRAAAAAADRSGLPGLRLQAWLAVETAARAVGRADAAAAARQAAAAVPAEAPPALAAELAVRAALAGDSDVSVPDGQAGAWAALLAGAAPPAGEDALSGGVAAWAAARALGRQGKGTEAAKAYLDALGELPTHRFGRLSLGTALDGSQGLPIAADLASVGELDVEAAPRVALAAHEVLHRVRDVARQVTDGRGLEDGLAPDVAVAALSASARARAEVGRWLLGGDPPDLAPVAEAEAQLATQPAFARLLPVDGGAAAAKATNDSGTALISLARVGTSLSGVVVSGRGLAVKDLGPADQVATLVARHAEALQDRAKVEATGNAVRRALLDPFNDQLSGVPRFVVVGPPELQRFGIAAVPEQDDALRWLEDIRDVTVAPTISTLVRPEHEYAPFRPDLLVVGRPADEPPVAEGEGAAEGAAKADKPADAPAEGRARKAGQEGKAGKAGVAALGEDEPLPGEIERGPYGPISDLAPEVGVAVRTFSRGVRQLVLGEHATLPTWEAGAPTARIVQISGVDVAPGGGFVLEDGSLSLARIRATPMRADLVLLTAQAPTETQLARAHAFLDAGVRTVVVSAWEPTTPDLERYVSNLYDAMNQERPVIRAMEQARLSVRNDPLRSATNTHPGVWGSWMMVGLP